MRPKVAAATRPRGERGPMICSRASKAAGRRPRSDPKRGPYGPNADRTPAPGNYTYVWRVRNFFFQLLNTTTTAGATFRYPIALDYTGTLRFEATVDDGQGTVAAGQQSATVAQAYMALSLDRGDYNPGDVISAFYGVTSHVITNPSYAYEVDDSNAVIVLSGTTSARFFSFRTPNPSRPSYTFHVTATGRGTRSQSTPAVYYEAGL